MADILWRKADCQNCKLQVPTALITRWGFDANGTLCIQGVCRFCLRPFTITHTREEQEADTREAFHLLDVSEIVARILQATPTEIPETPRGMDNGYL